MDSRLLAVYLPVTGLMIDAKGRSDRIQVQKLQEQSRRLIAIEVLWYGIQHDVCL